jgi:hypothetical protein
MTKGKVEWPIPPDDFSTYYGGENRLRRRVLPVSHKFKRLKATRCANFACLLALVVHLGAQTAPVPAKAPPVPPSSDQLSIMDFGGKGDRLFDNSSAFEAAARAASGQSRSVYFPCGVFRFARKPASLETGVRLSGCGSVGSNDQYGSNLIVDYDENQPEEGFLTWDGSFGKAAGKCCAGTGGGIDHLVIVKAAHRHGGTAIKVTGSEDNYRAGFFNINGVIVHANGDGSWAHDLVIDGTCCKTPNSQGVRDIHITDFFAAQAVSGAEAVLFRNATQVFWQGGIIFPAKAAPSSGLTITGLPETPYLNSTNIFISDVYMAGDMVIDYARNITYSGFIGADLKITPAARMVWITGLVGGKIDNRSTTATVLGATGVNPSSASVKHKRLQVTLPPGSTTTFTLPWDPPFPDLHYTASAQVLDASGQVRIVNIHSQTVEGITVAVENHDRRAAHSVTIQAIGVHD